MNMLKVTREQNGKTLNLGLYDRDDGIWYIERDKKKHYFRTLKAWGLDWINFKHLKSIGLKKIIVRDYITDKKWEIGIEKIDTDFLHFKKRSNVDYGLQIFIPENCWEKVD
jgi:hypothetical protein